MRRFLWYNIITLVFLLSELACAAQIENGTQGKKLKFTGFFSVARSTFDVRNFSSSLTYPSLEFRCGGGIAKPIGKNFELKSGLYWGLKVKRKSYLSPPSQEFPILRLDEAASSRNHFFADMPLTMQFNLPKPKIGFKAGLNSRFWAPNNKSVDVLTNKMEVGVLGGISCLIMKRISMGFEYYHGLTDIFGGSYFLNNGQLSAFHVKNQFTQLTFEHTF